MDQKIRSNILQAALRLRGVTYDDSHDGEPWKDLAARSTTLDCSAFVCRVAAEAGIYAPGALIADAAWLLDHLVEVASPSVGDIVGYGRAAIDESNERHHDVVWHVMIYAGNAQVVGACDLAGRVVVRPLEYEPEHGDRRWHLIEAPAFRALRLG